MKLSEQEQNIYDLLLRQGSATAREIIRFTNYPSSKIRDLKQKGIRIETTPIQGKNYDRYVLKDDQIKMAI